MNSTNIFAISALINGIVSITFGILVISKNWRDRMNQIFFFMTISFAVWSFSYWQWQLSTDYDTAMMWVRILSIGSLFIPILFYHWVIKLVNANTAVNKILLWLAYSAAVVILLFARTNLFIAGLERKSFFQFWPNAGIAYNVYFSYIYVGLILYTVYLLLRSYKTAEDVNKKGQILYIIFAVIFGFGGGLSNFPLWWGINIPPYGNFLAAAFPFLFGYSILKYKFFNIRAIIAELMVFSLMIFMLIIVLMADNWTLRLVYGLFFVLTSVVGVILIRNSYTVDNLNKAQSETMNFITHQIRGVFTDTKAGLAAMIEGDFGAIPDTMKDMARRMLESQNRGVGEVETFLKADRIDNGTVKYEMKPFDFKQMLVQLVEQEKSRAEGKKLHYEVQISDGDYNIDGDQVYINQVVFNLIDNAIRYTPSGSIEVSLSCKDNDIIFSVKDSGVGVNEEDGKKLFTKYGHGKDSRKINTDSNGLGLFIVKGIVDGHHGKIWYQSGGTGKGTTFFVELPIEQK